jgi:quercetin dioxygenase-like cupin family protein
MLTAKTTELELMQGWFDSDPEHARARVAFPINKWAGSNDSAAVYFEVEPGDRLARHTDSAEEVLYIVAGEAEAEVGDERGRLTAGDLAVIPPWSRTASSTSAPRPSRSSASSPRPRSSRASTSRSSRSASQS